MILIFSTHRFTACWTVKCGNWLVDRAPLVAFWTHTEPGDVDRGTCVLSEPLDSVWFSLDNPLVDDKVRYTGAIKSIVPHQMKVHAGFRMVTDKLIFCSLLKYLQSNIPLITISLWLNLSDYKEEILICVG